MAQYTLKYACGHGSTEKQLYGKTDERRRRIAWEEANLVCPDCYKVQAKAKDAAAPQVIYIETCGVGGRVSARASGQIDANKDALKEIGFVWSREYGGTLDLLSMKEPPLALVIHHTYRSEDEMRAWLQDLVGAVRPLGYKVTNNISALDHAVFARAAEKQEAERVDALAQLALNPRPARPEWYDAAMKASAPGSGAGCNGKLYGKPGYHRIYTNGVEMRLTASQAAEFTSYFSAFTAWKKAKGAAT